MHTQAVFSQHETLCSYQKELRINFIMYPVLGEGQGTHAVRSLLSKLRAAFFSLIKLPETQVQIAMLRIHSARPIIKTSYPYQNTKSGRLCIML